MFFMLIKQAINHIKLNHFKWFLRKLNDPVQSFNTVPDDQTKFHSFHSWFLLFADQRSSMMQLGPRQLRASPLIIQLLE
jgi:hypothetical protein